VVVGCAHAVQAIALLMLAADASLPVTASFLAGPPGAGDYGSARLGSLRIDWLVAAFFCLRRSTT
jgi:Heliorhodopsin